MKIALSSAFIELMIWKNVEIYFCPFINPSHFGKWILMFTSASVHSHFYIKLVNSSGIYF